MVIWLKFILKIIWLVGVIYFKNYMVSWLIFILKIILLMVVIYFEIL
jgi:hypothetical protein